MWILGYYYLGKCRSVFSFYDYVILFKFVVVLNILGGEWEEVWVLS